MEDCEARGHWRVVDVGRRRFMSDRVLSVVKVVVSRGGRRNRRFRDHRDGVHARLW